MANVNAATYLLGWTKDDVERAIKELGFKISNERPVMPQRVYVFELANGCHIAIWPHEERKITFHFDKWHVVYNSFKRYQEEGIRAARGSSVFIAYCHDRQTDCDELVEILKSMGHRPLTLKHEIAGNEVMFYKLDALIDSADFAIVLLTPDDRAKRVAEDGSGEVYQPRQNVILEYGMLLKAIGKGKILVLRLKEGDKQIALPLDVNNLNMPDYENSIGESKDKVTKEIKKMIEAQLKDIN